MTKLGTDYSVILKARGVKRGERARMLNKVRRASKFTEIKENVFQAGVIELLLLTALLCEGRN
jgi:hypothetical protein